MHKINGLSRTLGQHDNLFWFPPSEAISTPKGHEACPRADRIRQELPIAGHVVHGELSTDKQVQTGRP